jgi:hypothetical protein
MSEARIWYSRNVVQPTLPGDCRNTIVLSSEFFREIMDHPIPTDLQAAKALVCSPAALDLFTWLSYRCFIAKRKNGFRCSGITAWRTSSAVWIMRARESSGKSLQDGWR